MVLEWHISRSSRCLCDLLFWNGLAGPA